MVSDSIKRNLYDLDWSLIQSRSVYTSDPIYIFSLSKSKHMQQNQILLGLTRGFPLGHDSLGGMPWRTFFQQINNNMHCFSQILIGNCFTLQHKPFHLHNHLVSPLHKLIFSLCNILCMILEISQLSGPSISRCRNLDL